MDFEKKAKAVIDQFHSWGAEGYRARLRGGCVCDRQI
jgi:hypothetical protein